MCEITIIPLLKILGQGLLSLNPHFTSRGALPHYNAHQLTTKLDLWIMKQCTVLLGSTLPIMEDNKNYSGLSESIELNHNNLLCSMEL